MKIAMIGTGYVGLVSGACFSEFGVEVVCVDKDKKKIEQLKCSICPIYEPGLENLVASNVAAGRLSFTTDLVSAVKGADAIFIAVGHIVAKEIFSISGIDFTTDKTSSNIARKSCFRWIGFNKDFKRYFASLIFLTGIITHMTSSFYEFFLYIFHM